MRGLWRSRPPAGIFIGKIDDDQNRRRAYGAGHIDNAAAVALELSRTLERMAASMREKQDISYASDVVQTVTGAIPNFQLDLMVARPVREYQTKTRT